MANLCFDFEGFGFERMAGSLRDLQGPGTTKSAAGGINHKERKEHKVRVGSQKQMKPAKG
jgi:hypothetical protein